MKKRKKENDFIDDGRVIANMNIDGMPRSIIKRTAFDEFGKTKEKGISKVIKTGTQKHSPWCDDFIYPLQLLYSVHLRCSYCFASMFGSNSR